MIVRQAANLLDIFEFFARAKRPAALAEIADHFKWPRSSTFNLLTTLADKGYLYEPKPRAGYYPTPRWLSQAKAIAEAEPLPAWTSALIAELSDDIGETAAIAAPSGVMAVFVDVVEANAPVRYFAQVGHRIPIHATSSGRALLLQYARDERMALYRRIEFRPYGPYTPISIEALETELRVSKERGYCQSFADYSKDLAGVALPLPLGDRRLSVVVAGPMFRLEARMGDIATLIGETIARLRAGNRER
jgi:IclR family acetate operon transcriptional repressor